MRVKGFKIRGYDAKYERANFDIVHGYNAENNRVLEVTDIDSGITFIFETEERYKIERTKPKTSCWRSEK